MAMIDNLPVWGSISVIQILPPPKIKCWDPSWWRSWSEYKHELCNYHPPPAVTFIPLNTPPIPLQYPFNTPQHPSPLTWSWKKAGSIPFGAFVSPLDSGSKLRVWYILLEIIQIWIAFHYRKPLCFHNFIFVKRGLNFNIEGYQCCFVWKKSITVESGVSSFCKLIQKPASNPIVQPELRFVGTRFLPAV